jgi:hypothetical protein
VVAVTGVQTARSTSEGDAPLAIVPTVITTLSVVKARARTRADPALRAMRTTPVP